MPALEHEREPVKVEACSAGPSRRSTRNYRLFYVGQTISVVGTWMQRVAQDWLILELGGGAVGLAIDSRCNPVRCPLDVGRRDQRPL